MQSTGCSLLLLLLLSLLSMVLLARLELNPSLECTCSSTHFEDTRFAVKCRRNSSGQWNVDVNQEASTASPSEATPFRLYVEQSTVTCEQEQVPHPTPSYDKVDKQGYYKLHTDVSTWEQARRTCAREGAHLAIINSQKEADGLKNIFKRYPKIQDEDWLNNQAFIGVNDLANEGQYVTIFGQPLRSTGYERWAKGEPNDENGSEDCVVFSRDGFLNDEPCEVKFPFFCEQKL